MKRWLWPATIGSLFSVIVVLMLCNGVVVGPMAGLLVVERPTCTYALSLKTSVPYIARLNPRMFVLPAFFVVASDFHLTAGVPAKALLSLVPAIAAAAAFRRGKTRAWTILVSFERERTSTAFN